MLHSNNYYLNDRWGVWHRIELFNGLYTSAGASVELRSPFDTTYRFNNSFQEVIGNNEAPIQFDPYTAFRTNIGISWVPAQQYMTEPKRKVVLGSRWPTFSVYWERGWKNVFGSKVDFDYLSFTISQVLQIGTIGESRYKLKTGTFLNDNEVFLTDRKFFRESDREMRCGYQSLDVS